MTTFQHYQLARLRGQLRRLKEHELRIEAQIKAVEAQSESVVDKVLIQIVRWCA